MSVQEIQLIGQYIGNFHIIDLIGHGAMASVYRAFDTELERDVALKVPNPRHAEKPGFVDRFNQEATAMAQLRHRNIVQIYDVGEYNGLPFLALEYVHGVPLSGILEVRGRLDVDEAVEYILQVAEAIDCAHQRGIVHRDLKPSNILVESTGRVVVADFGISKILSGDSYDDTVTFIGTPMYMSPEQCGEGQLDQRTDIYSLGVIFYEMVVGIPPFTGETPAEIIKNHLLTTPKFPEDEEIKLPPRAITIIRKMLAKDPEQRYPDARSLIRELEVWKKDGHSLQASRSQREWDTGTTAPIVLCLVPRKILFGAVVSALKNINHRLISVSSSTELLAKLSGLDAGMIIFSHEPGKTGVFKLAGEIRATHRNQRVPIILLSHDISREEVETAFRSGINDIIAEPFDPSILVSKLESALVGEQRSIESRRFFRKAISGKIAVRIECEVLDISEGGMRIATNMALKSGEIVRFELPLFRELGFGEKAGKVVWISRNDGGGPYAFQAGFDFVDVTREERDRLRKWIFSAEIAGRSRRASIRQGPDMGPVLR